MFCPSCQNRKLYYVDNVDVDNKLDGVLPVTSNLLQGMVCEITMTDYDFEDLYDDPHKYTPLVEPHETWTLFFDYRHMEENIYEYM